MAYCGSFPGTCGHKPDCADTRCPGRAIGREQQRATLQRSDDFEVVAPRELARLQRELADEASRSDVECMAADAPSNSPMPVYDLTQLDPGLPQDDDMQADYRAALDKAVRYLDLRGLLVRPLAGQPHLVSFARAV